MINALAIFLAFSNLLLALTIFVLMVKPRRLFGLLAPLLDLSEAWQIRNLSESQELQLLLLARRIQWLGLLLLFCWSFFCGVIIAFFQL